jgi:hypothetical protein
MDTAVVPSRNRWPFIGLALTTTWLWAWALFPYANDLPRQIFMQQRMGFSTGLSLRLLYDWHLWAMAAAILLAAASWRVRRLRIAGAAGMVAVPAVLLMGLYLQMGLSVGEVERATGVDRFGQPVPQR